MTRVCTKCGLSKPATLDFFHKAKHGKYGLASICKSCTRDYYLSNSGLGRTHWHKDKKRCSGCGVTKPRCEFHFSNRSRGWLKGKCKECRSKESFNPLSNRNTPKHIREQRRLETRRAWYRRSYISNPEKFRQYCTDRRARLLAAEGDHTEEGWIAKVNFHGWRCAYCGCELGVETLTRDHKIPLSKNGTNWLANLVPACHKCNSGKRDRDYKEYSPKWIQRT